MVSNVMNIYSLAQTPLSNLRFSLKFTFRIVIIMSLASSPDGFFRPEDGFKSLFPSVEDGGNTLDDYLNEDFYHHSDEDSNKELSDALTEFFEKDPSTKNSVDFSPVTAPTKHKPPSPQPWRKGLWCLNQATGPDATLSKVSHSLQQRRSSVKRKVDYTGKEAFTNPRSPPATPSAATTKNLKTSPRAANLNPSTYARYQPLFREKTLSPSPMYGQQQYTTRTMQQDFQNFHLRLSEGGPLSLPSTSKATEQHSGLGYPYVANFVQNGPARSRDRFQNAYAFGHQLHVSEEGQKPTEQISLNPSSVGQAISSPGDQAVYTSWCQAGLGNGIPTWTTESLESSDESHYSYDSLQSLENAHLVQQTHTWQSPGLSANRLPIQQHYSQQNFYPGIVQPTPHRPAHQLIQQPPSVHAEGLGIRFPTSAALSPSMSNANISNPLQPYPPLPPPPVYAFTNEDPFSTPRRTRRQSSPLRSPSPCISPTNITRTLRQRSPTHNPSPTRTRRKSIGNAGPITHTAPPPPVPKAPKTPRTPRTPTGQGVIDFVNFTPKDSVKLLSDVAPSGSSKTRARREAEAREKRKRLNEAAFKAVRRAGGDVRMLKAEGLCLS